MRKALDIQVLVGPKGVACGWGIWVYTARIGVGRDSVDSDGYITIIDID